MFIAAGMFTFALNRTQKRVLRSRALLCVGGCVVKFGSVSLPHRQQLKLKVTWPRSVAYPPQNNWQSEILISFDVS